MPQMVPTDLNIGFQGMALIQGQIYNPATGYGQESVGRHGPDQKFFMRLENYQM